MIRSYIQSTLYRGPLTASTIGDNPTYTGILSSSAGIISLGSTPPGTGAIRIDATSYSGVGINVTGGHITATRVLDKTALMSAQTITENTSIPSGYNAISLDAVTIGSGISVTIAPGSTWTILAIP